MNKKFNFLISTVMFVLFLFFFLRAKKISEKGLIDEWELELKSVVVNMTKEDGNKNFDLILSDKSMYHVRFFDLSSQISIGDSLRKYKKSYRYVIYKKMDDSVIMDIKPNLPFYIKKPNSK